MNFDESSYYWRLNKISMPHGYFKYRCQYIHQNGKICSQPIMNDNVSKCKRHLLR